MSGVLNIAVILGVLTTALQAEVYTIDCTSSTKEVHDGGYIMGTPINPSGVALTTNNYYVLKLMHTWLQDFGTELAPMIPAMPAKRPTGVQDVNTFRCMVRASDNSGYVFFNNYQRYVENKDLHHIQIEARLKTGSLTFPMEPITIPKDTYGIWPINLNMNGAVLQYGTIQLFTKIPGQSMDTYFFFAHEGVGAELAFKNATIAAIDNRPVKEVSGRTLLRLPDPGIKSVIEVKPRSGKVFRLYVLSRQEALNATRHELWGQIRLVMTDGATTFSHDTDLEIYSTGRSEGQVWIYPSCTVLQAGQNLLGCYSEGLFSRSRWSVEPRDISLDMKQTCDGQLPCYEISIPSNALDNLHDVYLDVDHVCDSMTARLDGHLIGDWYYIGKHYRPSLRHWGTQVLGKTITFELTPLTAKTECFIEEAFLPDFRIKQAYAEIREIKAVPQYHVTLNQGSIQ